MRAVRTGVAVAASAVLLTACGGGDLESGGSGAPSETSTSGSTSSAATRPTEPTEPASTEPVEDPDGAPAAGDAAVGVVLEWLAAAQSGSTDAMADLTGSFSLRGAERFGGLEEVRTGLAEGMGAFADTRDARWSAVVVPSQVDSWIVVVEGAVTREGMTERDARSWLVHPEDDRGMVVEGFASSPPQVVAPPEGIRDLASDRPVEVYLAARSGSGTVLLDGEPLADGVDVATADADRLRVTALPPGGWPAGEHTVTVAGVPADAGAEGPWVSVAVPVVVG